MKRVLWISMLAYLLMVCGTETIQARLWNNAKLVEATSKPKKKKDKKRRKKDAEASKKERSIVVLYENDVHCAVDGYAKLAGLRDAIADTADVCLVSNGDYVQGMTVGAISKGQYVVDIMKTLNYEPRV